ncbi:MAG: leucyl aminopeptidase [Chloroflexi bacterium]|nr:leucyl aminopeptidase [Chloroflexota bacterium]
MKIEVKAGEIAKTETGAILVNHFEGEERFHENTEINAIDLALQCAISQLITRGELKGKLNEITLVNTLGKLPAPWVAIVGLGKRKELSLDRVRCAVAEACRRLRQKRIYKIATIPQGAGAGNITAGDAAMAITEAALLGTYTFRKHMTKPADYGEIERFQIITDDNSSLPALERGCQKGKIISEAVILTRDMVNEPANYMTPTNMAEVAAKLAQSHGLEITVLEREEMQKMGMGAMLGVAQGSRQPPKFIALRYKGKETDELDVALVGKGITFDSGGISIKPSEKMEEMKGDMAGGASVMAAISAVAQLKPKINVAAIVPATENLPDGNAQKPGDVLTAMNGKTIEIISTDAEGRLILADALAYAVKQGARAIVDIATLTGAIRVALGDTYTGAFSNNPELLSKVIAAGAEAGELIWQLPMHDDYKEKIKSEVADLKNTGNRYAGAITAAQFLAEFIGDTPWVHLDIAATSMSDKERGYSVKGATGVPVRTLVNLVLALAK